MKHLDKTNTAKPLTKDQRKHIAKRIEQEREALERRIRQTHEPKYDHLLKELVVDKGAADFLREKAYFYSYSGNELRLNVDNSPESIFTAASISKVTGKKKALAGKFSEAKQAALKALNETAGRAVDEVLLGGGDIGALNDQLAKLRGAVEKFARSVESLGGSVPDFEE